MDFVTAPPPENASCPAGAVTALLVILMHAETRTYKPCFSVS